MGFPLIRKSTRGISVGMQPQMMTMKHSTLYGDNIRYFSWRKEVEREVKLTVPIY